MQYSLNFGACALNYGSDAVRTVVSAHAQHAKHVQSMQAATRCCPVTSDICPLGDDRRSML